ncbi:MAG: TIGR02996 domain-containing protein [Gemmataceae bacterium]
MEEVALRREIVESPDEDLPRRVYADWLDDHGGPADQARAEFIRLQLDLHDLPPDDESRSLLERQERRLRKKHEREWLGPVAEHLHGWAFVRGFLSHVSLQVASLLRIHDTLLAEQPICSIRLTGTRQRGVLDELARLPFLERITSLDLSNNYLDGVTIERLVNSPFLTHLATLRFNDNPYGYDAIPTLVDASALGNLRTLELRRNNLTDSTAALLGDSMNFIHLLLLDLRGNIIGMDTRTHLRGLFQEGVRF